MGRGWARAALREAVTAVQGPAGHPEPGVVGLQHRPLYGRARGLPRSPSATWGVKGSWKSLRFQTMWGARSFRNRPPLTPCVHLCLAAHPRSVPPASDPHCCVPATPPSPHAHNRGPDRSPGPQTPPASRTGFCPAPISRWRKSCCSGLEPGSGAGTPGPRCCLRVVSAAPEPAPRRPARLEGVGSRQRGVQPANRNPRRPAVRPTCPQGSDGAARHHRVWASPSLEVSPTQGDVSQRARGGPPQRRAESSAPGRSAGRSAARPAAHGGGEGAALGEAVQRFEDALTSPGKATVSHRPARAPGLKRRLTSRTRQAQAPPAPNPAGAGLGGGAHRCPADGVPHSAVWRQVFRPKTLYFQ